MSADGELDPRVLETKILQKVNAAYRGAFQEKFPGQCEHILRLITERLHHGLDKRQGVIVTDPDTWTLTAEEIRELAQAMYYINTIRQQQNHGD